MILVPPAREVDGVRVDRELLPGNGSAPRLALAM
jgi:hypothetical protein